MKNSRGSEKTSDNLSNPVAKLKDRIVALSIDLDDKQKLCKVLKRKIEDERVAIAEVESLVAQEYAPELENEIAQQKKAIEEALSLATILMNEKKSLLQISQQTIETLQIKEKQLESDIKKISRLGEESIEQDKKAFKASYEDRIQGKIQEKLEEYKNSTQRALEPEIQRLKALHERELQELEYSHQKKQELIKDDALNKFRIRLASLEKDRNSEHQSKLRTIDENSITKQRDFETNHIANITSLREELDRLYNQEKTILSRRLERHRNDCQEEMIRLQKLSNSRIEELRNQQRKELIDLEKDYERKRRELNRSLEESKQHIEDSVVKESSSLSSRPHAHPHSHSHLHPKEPTSNHSILSNQEMEEIVSNLLRERDQKIQSEIKSFQTETIRLERQWKAASNKTISEIESYSMEEEKVLAKHLQSINNQITEIILYRQQKLSDDRISSLQKSLLNVTTALDTMTIEQNRLEETIQDNKDRIASFEAIRQRHHLDEEEVYRIDKTTLKEQVTIASNSLTQEKQKLETLLLSMDETYDRELERLDREVKENIGKSDEEIALLKEAIDMDKSAITRLEALIHKYSNHSNPTSKVQS